MSPIKTQAKQKARLKSPPLRIYCTLIEDLDISTPMSDKIM